MRTSTVNALHCIAADDIAPAAWRNGGGLTRELLRLPAARGDDDWHLRVSLADITADGAFSAFDSCTRWFAVIDGAGVRLSWRGDERLQRVNDAPIRFDGADAPMCILVDGATRDLNVMAHDGHVKASLERAEAGVPWRCEAPFRALFTLREVSLETGGGIVPLPPRTLAWVQGDTSSWRLAIRATTAVDDARASVAAGYWITATPSPALP